MHKLLDVFIHPYFFVASSWNRPVRSNLTRNGPKLMQELHKFAQFFIISLLFWFERAIVDQYSRAYQLRISERRIEEAETWTLLKKVNLICSHSYFR